VAALCPRPASGTGDSLFLLGICRRGRGARLGEGGLARERTGGLARSWSSESLVGVEEVISQHCSLFLQPGMSVL